MAARLRRRRATNAAAARAAAFHAVLDVQSTSVGCSSEWFSRLGTGAVLALVPLKAIADSSHGDSARRQPQTSTYSLHGEPSAARCRARTTRAELAGFATNPAHPRSRARSR